MTRRTDIPMSGTPRLAGSPVATVVTATRLLTADDLAERWSVSKAHVYRLSRERGLPTVRLGRYYRYRLAAIEAWEAAQEAGSNVE